VQQKISTINEQRTSPGSTKIDYGIALHIGEVYYGNIGGKNRLDFTVIGPAVNLTSRIESKTKELGQKLLVSEAFYDTSPDNLEFCAEMNLKGMSAPQKLYQLASSAGLK
jgi:adenylate cyclase